MSVLIALFSAILMAIGTCLIINEIFMDGESGTAGAVIGSIGLIVLIVAGLIGV